MNAAKPCVYHYLFSHIAGYTSEEEAKKRAENLVFRLKTDLRLKEDKTQRLGRLSHDVVLLSSHADEHTETYLLQLLCHDLIATILTYNQTETREAPLSFLRRKRHAHFPATPDQIGTTTVFFVQADTDAELVKQIAADCAETPVEAPLPFCRFEWGTLYALRHCASRGDSEQTASYVLLVPREADLNQGDRFLAYTFPLLESIRQKLAFEEREARKFKAENISREQAIKRLLDNIHSALRETEQSTSFQENLRQIDAHQAALYQNIAENEALLLTLEINLINFQRALGVLSPGEDTLFAPLPPEFHFIRRQIEYDLKYIKFLLPGIEKREELLRLQIEWQRKAAEEHGNRIKKMTNSLLFAFGATIGVGQLLADVELQAFQQISANQELLLKAGILILCGGIAFLLSQFSKFSPLKSFLEGKDRAGKIGRNMTSE